jgi:2-oxoglutarate ferredoxin oxidoreductase subunit alpha
MTPSTGIFNFVAGKVLTHGIVVERAEDEIAAMNMASAHPSRVRAMTGSSAAAFPYGGRPVSAGMTETPIVMALASAPVRQRSAVRTGRGTSFALRGSWRFRVILAPSTAESGPSTKAFDLAEKYQMVFILTDQYDSQRGRIRRDLKNQDADYRLRGDTFRGLHHTRDTPSRKTVSLLWACPVMQRTVVTDSDEHMKMATS